MVSSRPIGDGSQFRHSVHAPFLFVVCPHVSYLVEDPVDSLLKCACTNPPTEHGTHQSERPTEVVQRNNETQNMISLKSAICAKSITIHLLGVLALILVFIQIAFATSHSLNDPR